MTSLESTIIDGYGLSAEYRAVLKPGEPLVDFLGNTHYLPRYFYKVENWAQAKETMLSPHFTYSELVLVDCREDDLILKQLPHFLPCAASLLVRYLELLRERVGAPIHVAANGGYRSPAHKLSDKPGPHCWGTAVNIYRIGEVFLNSEEVISRYGAIAKSMAPEIYVKPFGHGPDETDDHLHLDIGYIHMVPRYLNEAVKPERGNV